MRKSNGDWRPLTDMKSKDWRTLWADFFDVEAIERTPKRENAATIRYDNNLETDGVAVSFVIIRKVTIEECDDEEKKKQQAEKLLMADQIYGFDVGHRLAIGGVRFNSDGSEDNIRLSSKEFHRKTGFYRRNKKRDRMTRTVDKAMSEHRESFGEQPGPRSHDFETYADHILKHFHAAIKAYTQYEYALQVIFNCFFLHKIVFWRVQCTPRLILHLSSFQIHFTGLSSIFRNKSFPRCVSYRAHQQHEHVCVCG